MRTMHATRQATTAPKARAAPTAVFRARVGTPTDKPIGHGCACGGSCPRCKTGQFAAAAPPIQRKPTISSPGDPFEREADEIADEVMRMAEPSPAGAAAGAIQRKCVDCEEDQKTTIYAKHASSAIGETELDTASAVRAAGQRGAPLPGALHSFFEPRFGHDFSSVRVHTDGTAAEGARAVQARAYTLGRDIVFGAGEYSPETHEGKRLLAHELTHVVQQGGADASRVGQRNEKRGLSPVPSLNLASAPSQILQRRALTTVEETAAIASGQAFFDPITVRVLQTITGVPAADRDGAFGSQTVRAISDWQSARAGLVDDGIVDEASMDRLVTDSLAGGRAEHGIQLVLDFYDLITATDTLAVRHRSGAATIAGFTFVWAFPIPTFVPGATTFEEGNLRVIEVDDAAFASATMLRDTIQRELARVAPAGAPVGATPARLNAAQVREAVRFTAARYTDERSVRAIQGLVGAPVTGIVDATTVQFIAEAQNAAGLGADGRVGLGTTEQFYTQMIARGNPNSALRLLVDFFDIRDRGNLLSVFFDPTVAALASTDFRPSEPVRVRVGPNALALPFSAAVHNIAHEMEHVRRLREGIGPASTHEFLGEAVEILSVGMPEEPLDPVTPTHDAFIDDATRCLNNWDLMPVADQRTFRSRFIAVRRRVLQRIDAGTPAQRAANAALRARYVAVVLP